MNDLENGWVINLDNDLAKHYGDSWTDHIDIGDDRISDFIYEKELGKELAEKLTSEYEPERIIEELIEMLRHTHYVREISRDEYELVSEHYYEKFADYLEGYEG